MSKTNPTDDEILRAAMDDLDDGLGGGSYSPPTPPTPPSGGGYTPQPPIPPIPPTPRPQPPSAPTYTPQTKKKNKAIPIIAAVAVIAVIGGAVAIISNHNSKSYVPTDNGYVDGVRDDNNAVDNSYDNGANEDVDNFDADAFLEFLEQEYGTVTYEGVEYKVNSVWGESGEPCSVEEVTTSAAKEAGLTCLRFTPSDGTSHHYLVMFYKNSYDEILNGKQNIYMSLIFIRSGGICYTTLYGTDWQDTILEYKWDSVHDDAPRNARWIDGNESVLLEETGYYEYTTADGSVYTTHEDAWNYLVSDCSDLKYVDPSYFYLGEFEY